MTRSQPSVCEESAKMYIKVSCATTAESLTKREGVVVNIVFFVDVLIWFFSLGKRSKSSALIDGVFRPSSHLIGSGTMPNLSKSSDADVLKVIILKLLDRVEAGATTLLIKVKVHRGDPLNEEAGIRTEQVASRNTRKRYGMTRPKELCINDPTPPQNTGGQQFLRLRYGLILCAIILDRNREKSRFSKPWK